MRSNKVQCNFLELGTADTASKGHVTGRDGDTLGVKAEKVRVLEKTNEVSLSSLLKSKDGGGRETEIVLEGRRDLTNKTLEGELADEEISGLLVSTDFTDSDGTRAVAVSLLDTAGRGGRLAGLLGSEGSAGSLTTVRLSVGTLSAGHDKYYKRRRGYFHMSFNQSLIPRVMKDIDHVLHANHVEL